MIKSRQEASRLLNEEAEKQSVKEKITQKQKQVGNQQISGQLPKKREIAYIKGLIFKMCSDKSAIFYPITA